MPEPTSAIFPVVVGDEQQALRLAESLRNAVFSFRRSVIRRLLEVRLEFGSPFRRLICRSKSERFQGPSTRGAPNKQPCGKVILEKA